MLSQGKVVFNWACLSYTSRQHKVEGRQVQEEDYSQDRFKRSRNRLWRSLSRRCELACVRSLVLAPQSTCVAWFAASTSSPAWAAG